MFFSSQSDLAEMFVGEFRNKMRYSPDEKKWEIKGKLTYEEGPGRYHCEEDVEWHKFSNLQMQELVRQFVNKAEREGLVFGRYGVTLSFVRGVENLLRRMLHE